MSIAHFTLCQLTLIAACLESFILPHVTNQNLWAPGRAGDIPVAPGFGRRGEGAGCKDNLPGEAAFQLRPASAADLPTKGDMPRTQPKAKVRTSSKTASPELNPITGSKGRRVHRGTRPPSRPLPPKPWVPGLHGVPAEKQPSREPARPTRAEAP